MNRPRWPFNLANGRPQTIDSIVDGIGQISSQNAQATRSKHDSLFGTIQNDGQLTLEQSICEDLRVFENRIVEVIGAMYPYSKRWQIILILSFVATMIGAFQWLTDPGTYDSSIFVSFWNHKFFTASCLMLIFLFVTGIHRRICAPSIIRSRVQDVIAQFNMSCDDNGRLILMPHPNYHHHLNQNNGDR